MTSLFDLPFEDEPDAPAKRAVEPEVRERLTFPESQGRPEPRRGTSSGEAPRRTVRTVSELTAGIRDLLETAYLDVWVEGEISNCRLWNTGHLYFTLKDPGSQVKAVMFKSDVRSLKFKPEDGLHVVARGRLSVYDPKGEYQIVCERPEPQGRG